MAKRIGVVGIVIEEKEKTAREVNNILSQYGDIIVGRMGVPRPERSLSVISLIVEGDTDQVGALTGKLGRLPGVIVKSALTGKNVED